MVSYITQDKYSVKVTIDGLSLTCDVVYEDKPYHCQETLYYLCGNFQQVPNLCHLSEEEFYTHYKEDLGASYVVLHAIQFMIISFKMNTDYLKVFITEDGLEGSLLLKANGETHYTFGINTVVDIKRLGGGICVESVQR